MMDVLHFQNSVLAITQQHRSYFGQICVKMNNHTDYGHVWQTAAILKSAVSQWVTLSFVNTEV